MSALLLILAVTVQQPALLDDPSSNYCLATGYCRVEPGRPPASGALFVALGLVVAGVTGVRAERRRNRHD